MTTQVIKQDEVGRIATTAARLQGNIEQVIVGKGDIVVLCLVAILSEGHLLIEDVPGTGKNSSCQGNGPALSAAPFDASKAPPISYLQTLQALMSLTNSLRNSNFARGP